MVGDLCIMCLEESLPALQRLPLADVRSSAIAWQLPKIEIACYVYVYGQGTQAV